MRNRIKFGVLLFVVSILFGISHQSNGITADKILQLVNQDRARYGLSALELDPTLNLAAYAKAEDMSEKGYFNHVSPEGTKPWDFFKALGYDYTFAGENLALNFSDPRDLESSWMSSPSHRENILSPNYSDLGLAVVSQADRIMVVQFFGSRDNHQISFTPLSEQGLFEN
ncbi:MAG: CAP domain-containing protein [Candidatus Saccharibacteria bacterium]